jgi:hypothetical protein
VVSVSLAEKGPRAAVAAACAGTTVPARRTSTVVPGQVLGQDLALTTGTALPGQKRGTKALGLHQSERTGPRQRTTGPDPLGIWDRWPAQSAAKRYLQETTEEVAGPPCQWEKEREGQEPEGWWCWRKEKRTHRTPHGEK